MPGPWSRTVTVRPGASTVSLARQRQLVADASHELRRPLATVRTNRDDDEGHNEPAQRLVNFGQRQLQFKPSWVDKPGDVSNRG